MAASVVGVVLDEVQRVRRQRVAAGGAERGQQVVARGAAEAGQREPLEDAAEAALGRPDRLARERLLLGAGALDPGAVGGGRAGLGLGQVGSAPPSAGWPPAIASCRSGARASRNASHVACSRSGSSARSGNGPGRLAGAGAACVSATASRSASAVARRPGTSGLRYPSSAARGELAGDDAPRGALRGGVAGRCVAALVVARGACGRGVAALRLSSSSLLARADRRSSTVRRLWRQNIPDISRSITLAGSDDDFRASRGRERDGAATHPLAFVPGRVEREPLRRPRAAPRASPAWRTRRRGSGACRRRTGSSVNGSGAPFRNRSGRNGWGRATARAAVGEVQAGRDVDAGRERVAGELVGLQRLARAVMLSTGRVRRTSLTVASRSASSSLIAKTAGGARAAPAPRRARSRSSRGRRRAASRAGRAARVAGVGGPRAGRGSSRCRSARVVDPRGRSARRSGATACRNVCTGRVALRRATSRQVRGRARHVERGSQRVAQLGVAAAEDDALDHLERERAACAGGLRTACRLGHVSSSACGERRPSSAVQRLSASPWNGGSISLRWRAGALRRAGSGSSLGPVNGSRNADASPPAARPAAPRRRA